MLQLKKLSGFTLIELLVVIAIIGVLSTLAVIALGSARVKARDSKRLSDIKQISTALELYYDDNNSYPDVITPGNSLVSPDDLTTYLNKIPSNPSPRDDGDCPDQDYVYAVVPDSREYLLGFCLGNNNTQNPGCFTPSGFISDNCLGCHFNNVGCSWQMVGGSTVTPKIVGDRAMANVVIKDHIPYIAYSDADNGGKMSVKRFVDNSWEYVGSPGISSRRSNWNKLFVYQGILYSVYTDGVWPTNQYDGGLSVVKFNGSNWEFVGPEHITAGYVSWPNLAFDSSGTIYIAYEDKASDDKMAVKKFNGLTWESVGGSHATTDKGHYGSLSILDDVLYIGFKDWSVDQKASVMKFNGISWEYVGVPGFSDGQAEGTHMVIDQGVIYIAFSDGARSNKASVMKFNGTSWEYVGTPGFSDGETIEGWSVNLAVYYGVPYVVYKDATASNSVTVRRYSGTSWEYVGPIGMSNEPAEMAGNSIIVADGTVFITYDAWNAPEGWQSKSYLQKFAY